MYKKTSLHERCIKTVIEFLLACIVYAIRFLKLPCVLLRMSVVLIKNDDDNDDDEILRFYGFQRPNLRHCAKFYQHR